MHECKYNRPATVTATRNKIFRAIVGGEKLILRHACECERRTRVTISSQWEGGRIAPHAELTRNGEVVWEGAPDEAQFANWARYFR